jgi:hypothetical protein
LALFVFARPPIRGVAVCIAARRQRAVVFGDFGKHPVYHLLSDDVQLLLEQLILSFQVVVGLIQQLNGEPDEPDGDYQPEAEA